MTLELAPLPYARSALSPQLSARTLDLHYERHHKGYLRKLAKLVHGKPEEALSLEELVRSATGEVYDNAAQVWNHSFYWRSMRPGGGGEPERGVREPLLRSFGSLADFKRRLGMAGAGRTRAPAHPEHLERREPATARLPAAPHPGRVGARLLPRLPGRARALRAGLPR